MQADFNLSYAQLGLMPALYMVGLMVACIIFNELTNYVNSFRLVGTHSHSFCQLLSHYTSAPCAALCSLSFAFQCSNGPSLRQEDSAGAVQLLTQGAAVAGIGLAMWALGAVFTGVSFNYGWLLFARIFTGAGLAPPLIRI